MADSFAWLVSLLADLATTAGYLQTLGIANLPNTVGQKSSSISLVVRRVRGGFEIKLKRTAKRR
jgi:hypothetical protein